MSSVIGKILDKVVLGRNEEVLSTSDFQFGYKNKHSTTQCSFVIEEVINYYHTKGSSVYTMFLDASKAFDRVNYVKVFRLLIRKGMCPLELRFFANLYCNNECRIKWQEYLTETFKVTNGVKQGGVLSPVLFIVYIDELLLNLQKSKYGCYVADIFMGAFAYADDIVILAPTKYELSYKGHA